MRQTATKVVSLAALATTTTPGTRVVLSLTMPLGEWRGRAKRHRERVVELLGCEPEEAAKRRTDPKLNFIFQYYYGFKAKHLLHWSPGLGVDLEPGTDDDERLLAKRTFWRRSGSDGRLTLDPCYYRLKPSHVEALRSTRAILRATNREVWNCYGLHEWAMLYRSAPKKQDHLELRVSQKTIDDVVEAPGALRCTHFDAFRFFDDAAKPLNLHRDLGRDRQPFKEQRACVHYNMDLFKYALRLMPFIEAELLADALSVALQARTLDLRASPYDVRAWADPSEGGAMDPVPVETPAGRKLYTDLQADIVTQADPVRRRLASACDAILASIDSDSIDRSIDRGGKPALASSS
mmetsp:Transcript_37708/g.120994  ORF Transcript_37708/g.120994 Transcript_37708/m.120994 type:complete len:350 (+) Transcript_37708:1658-2707(+)